LDSSEHDVVDDAVVAQLQHGVSFVVEDCSTEPQIVVMPRSSAPFGSAGASSGFGGRHS
jgi:hypothetical protein